MKKKAIFLTIIIFLGIICRINSQFRTAISKAPTAISVVNMYGDLKNILEGSEWPNKSLINGFRSKKSSRSRQKRSLWDFIYQKLADERMKHLYQKYNYHRNHFRQY